LAGGLLLLILCTHVPPANTGVGLKAAWYGAEVFGDLLAKGKKADGEQDSSSKAGTATAAAAAGSGAKPIDAVLESIRADYAEDYFISGKGDMAGERYRSTSPFQAFQHTSSVSV
jgi:hypothetical protein